MVCQTDLEQALPQIRQLAGWITPRCDSSLALCTPSNSPGLSVAIDVHRDDMTSSNTYEWIVESCLQMMIHNV